MQIIIDEANSVFDFLPLKMTIEAKLAIIQRLVQALIDRLYHI
jgi:hypothetical protein